MKRSGCLPAAIVIVLAVCESASGQCAWEIVPTPSPGAESNLLVDVVFSGPDEGLAVGNWTGGGRTRVPMVQHWDGGAWSLAELPDAGHIGTNLAVEGAGRIAGDLWVTGYVDSTYPTNNLPVMARWGGDSWDYVASATLNRQNTYPFADRSGFGWDIDGVAADDLWVVGIANGYGDARASTVAMALHFNGSDWSDVEVPIVGNRSNRFYKLSASASDNVWAIGLWRNTAGPFQALIARWDGNRWEIIRNPGEGPWTGHAEAIVALAPDDVWVSGEFNDSTDFLIHWDGADWTAVDAGVDGTFAAFAALGPDDIWASSPRDSRFYHFDGEAWSPVDAPSIPGAPYILRGWGMSAVDACQVWSVGGWFDGTTQYALSERLTDGGLAGDLNCDGAIDAFDIEPFILALTDPAGYAAAYPGCDHDLADVNGDGAVDAFDIEPFVGLLAP